MRIALFHNLPSGGGKRAAYGWVKPMAKNHDVDLFLYDSQAEDFLDMRPFVKKTTFVGTGKTGGTGYLSRLSSLFRTRSLSKAVARHINSGNYDLAVVMQCKVNNTPFVLRHLNIPSLYFCHEPLLKSLEPHYSVNRGILTPFRQMFTMWKIRTDRANAQYASLICANSLYSRENVYRAYGVYPRMNYPGIDADLFHPLSIKRERVVLSVGSLVPSKAPEFIIESVGTMQDKPAVRFISHVSAPHYQAQLSQLAQRLGVSVSFDRLVSDNDLAIAYNQVALTVFPSMLEPFGFIPLESLSCETPVVGVAEGGIRETVCNGETGILTERDPEEFGNAIAKLLSDDALRARMGTRGREQVLQNWTWSQSYQELEKHMRLAIKRHSVSKVNKTSKNQ